MSHITTMEFVITDLDALARAAATLEGEARSGQTTFTWYGRFVGASPMPAGFAQEDLGKCEHALRFKGCGYEVGVVRRRDGKPGWTLLYDAWSSGGLERHLGKGLAKLKQAYTAAVTQKAMLQAGYRVTVRPQANGKLAVICER